MNVSEIMTTEVVTVTPETPLKEVAGLLAGRRIAGLPVCNAAGEVVGVVSEGDILWKETGLAAEPDNLIARILNVADGEDKRVGAHTAGDAMTSPALTIPPTMTVARAAKLMIDNRVNRLPVVDDGVLVGIVARSDLVRAFTRSDAEIAHEIEEDVLLRTLWIDPHTLSVTVENGNVTVGGEVDNHSTADLIETYVRRIPGVVGATSEVTWAIDDQARRTALAAAQLPRKL
jgi:CBS domain-containing protein